MKIFMLCLCLLATIGCVNRQVPDEHNESESALTMLTAAAINVARTQVYGSQEVAEGAVFEWAYNYYGLGKSIKDDGFAQAHDCYFAPKKNQWFCARDGDRDRYFCSEKDKKSIKQPCPLDDQAYPTYCYGVRDTEEASCQRSFIFDPGKRGEGRLEAGSVLWDEHREQIKPYLKKEIWHWQNKTSGCCRVCKKGKPCGNSCIARSKTCRVGPGCAC